MCLAIPGQIVEFHPAGTDLATVDVSGVRRRVNIGLLDGQDVQVGDWVLIHVGFAMNKIGEEQAHEQMRMLALLGEDDGRPRRVQRHSRSRVRRPAMKYVDEYRDPHLITKVADEIRRLAAPDRHYRLMEVCGGHTHAIYRFGLKDLLPPNIELVHGPGCPVCVLPMGRIDDGLAMAEDPRVILTAFGDMMRVPGTKGSLLAAQGEGLRRAHRLLAARCAAPGAGPSRPARRVLCDRLRDDRAVDRADAQARQALGVRNFSVFSNHVTIIPAIRAILDSPDMRIDAFIGPGHVSTVIGCRPYEWIAKREGKPIVVTGFEPLDLLQSIAMLLRQLRDGTGGGGEPVQPRRAVGGQPRGARSDGRRVRAAPLLRVARHGIHLTVGAAAQRPLCRRGTPSGDSPCPASR